MAFLMRASLPLYCATNIRLHSMNTLEIVKVEGKYRITITRSIRDVVPLKIGQKVAIVPLGDKILVQPLPDDPEEKLAELTEGFEFNRKARERASKFLLSRARRKIAN